VAPEPHARPPKPQVKETKAKVNGHVHGIHTRQVRGARTPKSVASSSVRGPIGSATSSDATRHPAPCGFGAHSSASAITRAVINPGCL
jgi:hypothetical protein